MKPKNTAHTPGPWNVERPYGEPGVYISGPNTGLIAELWHPDAHLFNRDQPVSIDANARLIAAAPDMLKALIETADQLEDLIEATEGLSGLDSFQQDALANSRVVLGKVARAAIAKAEDKCP